MIIREFALLKRKYGNPKVHFLESGSARFWNVSIPEWKWSCTVDFSISDEANIARLVSSLSVPMGEIDALDLSDEIYSFVLEQ